MSVLPAPATRDRLLTGVGLAVSIVATGAIIGRVAVYDPTLILGAAQALLWLLLFVWVFRRGALLKVAPALRRLVMGGLGLRVPIVLAHIAIGFWIFGGQVDFLGYFGNASAASIGMFSGDFRRLEFGEDPDLGGWIVTVLYVPIYLLLGASLFGMFLWSAIVGFTGAFFFLRAFESQFGSGRDTRLLALCLFFYPSVAFWSSLLGKDSWMFFFLGLMTYGLTKMLADPRPANIWPLAVGAWFVTMIRPPIGAVIIIGTVTAFLVASRGWMMRLRGPTMILRPIIFIGFGIVLVLGSYAAVIRPLARYGVFGGEHATPIHGLVALGIERHVGGATDDLEEGAGSAVRKGISVNASMRELLLFLPESLVTFFFRPHIFEAHNVLARMAALDSTLLLLLIMARWRHAVAAVRGFGRHPLIAFALVVTALLSVGLSFESNLGTLVRHRVMVMPFLFLLLAGPREQPPVPTERA